MSEIECKHGSEPDICVVCENDRVQSLLDQNAALRAVVSDVPEYLLYTEGLVKCGFCGEYTRLDRDPDLDPKHKPDCLYVRAQAALKGEK
jgi:hypothetical protein